MCRFEEEEKIPSFDFTKYYPDLEQRIKELLLAHATFEKLEPFQVSPHIIERFVNTLGNGKNWNVKLVFHGTMTANFANIQKRGFLVPGKSGLPVVNGNAYGSGIYLSTCPKMSLSYVRDHPKLLVCALLEGDRTKVTSHGVIRVAKDPAYVLPCYILHYKGAHPRPSSRYQRIMSNPHTHTFIFCLISFIKLLLLCLCLSIIFFIGTLSCLGYSYFTDRPYNPTCSEVNIVIWNSYVYIFYSVIFNGIYYIILWPLYYITMAMWWITSRMLNLFSFITFWIFYLTLSYIINTNIYILAICSFVLLAGLYAVEKKNQKKNNYYPRIARKQIY